MTPEQINRLMAEKVMDFTKHGHNSWLNANDGEIWFLDEFDPYHRIEHAMMALEKFNVWLLENLDGKVVCRIIYQYTKDGIGYWSRGEADTAPAAICLACIVAKETGVSDDTD